MMGKDLPKHFEVTQYCRRCYTGWNPANFFILADRVDFEPPRGDHISIIKPINVIATRLFFCCKLQIKPYFG